MLILPFAFGWIGAGDVKFFGVVGALLGVSWLPRVFFYSALIAGLIAVGYLAMGLAHISRFKEFWLNIKITILSMGSVLPDPVHVTDPRGRRLGSLGRCLCSWNDNRILFRLYRQMGWLLIVVLI